MNGQGRGARVGAGGRSFLLSVLATALVAGSCAPALFVPPVGPGEPAPEAAAAWAEASASCRDARTYAAQVRLSGRVADTRVPTVRSIVALTNAGEMHLNVIAGARPMFTLAGNSDRAVFLLHEDRRVVTARADEILEATIGIRLGPERLLRLVTGCVIGTAGVDQAARFGRRLRITTADGVVFLEQRAGVWQAAAGVVDGLRVMLRRENSAFPTEVRLGSEPGRAPVVSLTIGAEQVEVNGPVVAALFASPRGVAEAAPMTLEELRAAGPLREKKQ